MRRCARFPSRRRALSSRSLKGRYKTVGGDDGLASAPLPVGAWALNFETRCLQERGESPPYLSPCAKTWLTTQGTSSLSHPMQPSCTFQQERKSRRMTLKWKSALLQRVREGSQSSRVILRQKGWVRATGLVLVTLKVKLQSETTSPTKHGDLLTRKEGCETRQQCFPTSQVLANAQRRRVGRWCNGS